MRFQRCVILTVTQEHFCIFTCIEIYAYARTVFYVCLLTFFLHILLVNSRGDFERIHARRAIFCFAVKYRTLSILVVAFSYCFDRILAISWLIIRSASVYRLRRVSLNCRLIVTYDALVFAARYRR